MTLTPTRTVPINALAPGVRAIRAELDAAINRVLESGWFLMGPESERFEGLFAEYHGGPPYQTIGVGTGTDALRIALEAMGIGQGDDVLVVANAGVPPVAAVVATGARPIFCEVDPHTHTLDPAEIDRRVTPASKAVLVVHLYGRAAEMDPILDRARAHGLRVLEDCAQAHGARHRGKLVGTFGDVAAFSFFPTKNLGALGDGGAILTADPAIAERSRRLRLYGWREKYRSEEHSTVTRLDELQAAVLAVKLPHLDDWNAIRRAHARQYARLLEGIPGLELPGEPSVETGSAHVFHLYVVRTKDREGLRAYLREHGIGTDVHYPLPAHLQKPYRQLGQGAGSLPETERIAEDILSLPMFPELTSDDLDYVAEHVRAWTGQAR